MFIRDSRHYTTVSQGFKIELNDMHGKLKSQASYAETDSINPISYTKNFYLVQNQNALQSKLKNTVPVMDSANGHVKEDGMIGKDIELMVDMREQKSETVGANMQINGDIFILPIGIFPLILKIPSFIPKPNHAVSIYRAASTMKVISNYGILDSVVHFEKGSIVSVKNMVYDQETGDAVLVRTLNAFNDPVYSFSYPSHWAYDGTGPAYKNIGYNIGNIFGISDGLLQSTNKSFTHGDEVLVKGIFYLGGNCFETTPVIKKYWVLGGDKVGDANKLYLIDDNGVRFNGLVLNYKTLRSGRRNIMSSVGNVTALTNPLKFINNQWSVYFNDSSKVLSASAIQLKDEWKGDSSLTCKIADTNLTINPFLHGLVGNWRTYRNYTYYSQRLETNPNTSTNIRKDGTFASFLPFWNFSSNNLISTMDTARWVWNSEITMVNRKGFEIENKDPLGRYNSGIYGYNHTLPVAIAQNARYKEVAFDGFEDYNDFINCDTCPAKSRLGISVPPVIDTQHHTGKYSLRVGASDFYAFQVPLVTDSVSDGLGSLYLSTKTKYSYPLLCYFRAINSTGRNLIPAFSPTPNSKIIVSAWVKEQAICSGESYTQDSIRVVFSTGSGLVIQGIKPSGDIIDGWQRCEGVVQVPANATFMTVLFYAAPSSTAYFDDLRIHPFNANLKSFVYHPTNLRLMAELDENNYATFYEYDEEGTLIRLKKETVKGVKTIKETRTALLKQ